MHSTCHIGILDLNNDLEELHWECWVCQKISDIYASFWIKESFVKALIKCILLLLSSVKNVNILIRCLNNLLSILPRLNQRPSV